MKDNRDAERVIRLSSVLYVPDLSCNLFIVRDITDKGNRMMFDDITCIVITKDDCKWTQARELVCARRDHRPAAG